MQREIFVGSLNFWAMFGALLAQTISDRFGRRMTFVIAAVGFLIGIFLMIISGSYAMLLLGRMFVGWGVGIGLAIDPLYISEVTPAKHRGQLVTWSEIALNVGIVFGFSTGLFLSGMDDKREWRVMFLLGAIMPVIMIIVVFTIMPESPRWLVQKGRDTDAMIVLQQIYPEGFNVEPVVADIKEAIERDTTARLSVGWDFLFSPSPALRRMVMVGVGTAVAQQAVGIDAIQYYLMDVIRGSGIESREGQSMVLMILGGVKLFFIFVGGKFFDRSGRRPLFFISLIGMTASLLLVSIGFMIDGTLSTRAIVLGLGIYLSFFSIGMGPGAWLIPSEVFSNVIRAKAMSMATLMNRAVATLMASTFLSTKELIGWAAFFLLLAVVCLLVLGFLAIYLPETKGRSLEDMSLYFAELTQDDTVLQVESELVRRRQAPDGSSLPAGGGEAPSNEVV